MAQAWAWERQNRACLRLSKSSSSSTRKACVPRPDFLTPNKILNSKVGVCPDLGQMGNAGDTQFAWWDHIYNKAAQHLEVEQDAKEVSSSRYVDHQGGKAFFSAF
jgi:hypothetical protein